MMSEWYQNTLPQAKLAIELHRDSLREALSRPRFLLVDRARHPSARTNKINNFACQATDDCFSFAIRSASRGNLLRDEPFRRIGRLHVPPTNLRRRAG